MSGKNRVEVFDIFLFQKRQFSSDFGVKVDFIQPLKQTTVPFHHFNMTMTSRL